MAPQDHSEEGEGLPLSNWTGVLGRWNPTNMPYTQEGRSWPPRDTGGVKPGLQKPFWSEALKLSLEHGRRGIQAGDRSSEGTSIQGQSAEPKLVREGQRWGWGQMGRWAVRRDRRGASARGSSWECVPTAMEIPVGGLRRDMHDPPWPVRGDPGSNRRVNGGERCWGKACRPVRRLKMPGLDEQRGSESRDIWHPNGPEPASLNGR